MPADLALEHFLSFAHELGYNGATIALTDDDDDNGPRLRLVVNADQDYNPFEDSDCYGAIADATPRYGEQRQRPEGFDGNAEVLWPPQNGCPVWWQPPKDGPKRGTPEFRDLRNLVLDLAAFGGSVVTVEYLSGSDAYSRPIVRDAASLGGIDSLDGGYLTEVVSDLLAELWDGVSGDLS
jgi:hypothetical protein